MAKKIKESTAPKASTENGDSKVINELDNIKVALFTSCNLSLGCRNKLGYRIAHAPNIFDGEGYVIGVNESNYILIDFADGQNHFVEVRKFVKAISDIKTDNTKATEALNRCKQHLNTTYAKYVIKPTLVQDYTGVEFEMLLISNSEEGAKHFFSRLMRYIHHAENLFSCDFELSPTLL